MYASQIVEQGPTTEILARPRHPYTRALLDCTPHGARYRRLSPIPGSLPNPIAPPQGCRFHPRCRFAKEKCAQTDPLLELVSADHVTRCIRWDEIEL